MVILCFDGPWIQRAFKEGAFQGAAPWFPDALTVQCTTLTLPCLHMHSAHCAGQGRVKVELQLLKLSFKVLKVKVELQLWLLNSLVVSLPAGFHEIEQANIGFLARDRLLHVFFEYFIWDRQQSSYLH